MTKRIRQRARLERWMGRRGRKRWRSRRADRGRCGARMRPTAARSNGSCAGKRFYRPCRPSGLPPWNGLKRHGQGAPAIDFASDLIAAGHLVSDFLLLATLGRGKNPGYATAVRMEFSGKDFQNSFW